MKNATKVLRTPARKDYDLFTFVAEVALKKGKPVPITCNCGEQNLFNPPFTEEAVHCSGCGRSIGLIVMEGDPGYFLSRDASGNKQLVSAQGSSARPVSELTREQRQEIIQSFGPQ